MSGENDETRRPAGAMAPGPARDLDGEAMRRRIASRLFGEACEAVWLGRFRVIEALGEGGMGVVHAAEDTKLDRRVAIKVIRDERLQRDPDARARLLREARALAKLSHPNVVHVYEVGEHEGGVFIVMELIRGTTLQAWLAAEARSLPEIIARFLDAGEGLAAAHRVGVVHRDFKPANVLVGEDGRVRIVDFGLARGAVGEVSDPAPDTVPDGSVADAAASAVGAALSSTRKPAGTPGYMSPEQALGERCDARSDQYSFCVALFEALYGRRPAAHAFAVMQAQGAVVPADRRVPGWLRRVLIRGLAVRPEDRFPTMAALLVALREIPRRRRRALLGVAGSLALVLAMVLGLLLRAGPVYRSCSDPAQRLGQIWGPTQRDAIAAAFAATRLPFAPAAWRQLEPQIDTYAQLWIAARGEVCETSVVGQERLDERVRCLEDARASLAQRLTLFAGPDAEAVAEADALMAALPTPARCLDPRLVRVRSAAPGPLEGWSSEESLREREAAELRAIVDRAAMFMQTRQGREAAALLEPAISRLQQRGEHGLRAEALLLLGKVQAELLREPVKARDSLDLADNTAVRAGRRDLLWDAHSELAVLHARHLRAPEQARRHWNSADSHRVDAPAGLDLDTALTLGRVEILRAENKAKEAVELAYQLVELLRTRPTEPLKLTAAHEILGMSLGDAGEFEEAAAVHRALLAEATRMHGAEHPATARYELKLGRDYFDREEDALARRHVEHAREVFLTSYGRIHERVAAAEALLAYIDEREEKFDRAIDHARAARTIYGEVFPRGHNDQVAMLVLLSGLYRVKEAWAQQLEVSRELLAIHEEGLSTIDLDPAGLLTNVGESLCELGRCGEALPYFDRLRAAPGEPATVALALRGIGRAKLAIGDPGGLALLEQALESFAREPHEREGIAENQAATARMVADELQRRGRSPGRVRALRKQAAQITARLAAPAESAAQ